jgi:hypothetical protein
MLYVFSLIGNSIMVLLNGYNYGFTECMVLLIPQYMVIYFVLYKEDENTCMWLFPSMHCPLSNFIFHL